MPSQIDTYVKEAQKNKLPPPYWLNIENTLRCNLECPMCLQHIEGTTRTGIHMDLGLFERIAEEMFPHVQRVCWSVAGEPTLAPSFETFVDIANRYPIKTEIVTNATLLHRGRILEKLMPNLHSFQVSLDGATQETYEKIRVRANWDRVLDNLRLFQSERMRLPVARRPLFLVFFVLMRQNVHELPLLVDLAHEFGAEQIDANHMHVFSPDLRGQSLLEEKERANRFFDAARARGEALGIRVVLPPNFVLGGDSTPKQDIAAAQKRPRKRWSLRRRLDKIRVALDPRERDFRRRERLRLEGIRQWEQSTGLANRCDYLWGKAYISAGGDVSPCCMPGRPIVGNLSRQSFDEIWNGEELNRMRAHLSSGEPYHCCAHCSLFRDSMHPEDEEIWMHESAEKRSTLR